MNKTRNIKGNEKLNAVSQNSSVVFYSSRTNIISSFVWPFSRPRKPRESNRKQPWKFIFFCQKSVIKNIHVYTDIVIFSLDINYIILYNIKYRPCFCHAFIIKSNIDEIIVQSNLQDTRSALFRYCLSEFSRRVATNCLFWSGEDYSKKVEESCGTSPFSCELDCIQSIMK